MSEYSEAFQSLFDLNGLASEQNVNSVVLNMPFAGALPIVGKPLNFVNDVLPLETVVPGVDYFSFDRSLSFDADLSADLQEGIDALTGLPDGLVSSSGSLEAIRQAAIDQWTRLDLSVEQLDALENTPLRWDSLSGTYLGLHSADGITLDIDAAGQGWFVDPTPWESSEFSIPASTTELQAEVSDAPFGHIDLLTVVTHELGHAIGLDHPHEKRGDTNYVMNAGISTGIRRLADEKDLELAHKGEWQHLAQPLEFVDRPVPIIVELGGNSFNPWTSANHIASAPNGHYVVTWVNDSLGDDNIYAQLFNAQGVPLTEAILVNKTTHGEQTAPGVVMDGNGNFIIAWSSYNQDAVNTWGVYGQRFDATGQAIGQEFRINTYEPSDQENLSIAGNINGDFVVLWDSNGQDGYSEGVYGQRYDAQGTPQGQEFRVNTQTSRQQQHPSVAITDSGEVIATWSSYNQDLSWSWGVYVQRFGVNGEKLGTETLVNTVTSGHQLHSRVATDTEGNFVIVWQGDERGSSDLYGQRFNASGEKDGGAFLIGGGAGAQSHADIAFHPSGEFVVTWQDGENGTILARLFNADGTPQGDVVQVSPDSTHDHKHPSITLDNTGFIIAWTEEDADGSSSILTQRFAHETVPPIVAGVTTQNTVTRINSYELGNQNNSAASAQWMAIAPNGEYIVTWVSSGQGSADTDIYAQRFNAEGIPMGEEFKANTDSASFQSNPGVSFDGNGNFTIVWQQWGDGSDYGVYGQRFDSDSNRIAEEFRINSHISHRQSHPTIATDVLGNSVVLWSSQHQDGSGYGIYGQRLDVQGVPIGDEFQLNTFTSSDQIYSQLAMDIDGSFVATWMSNGQDGSGRGVYARRYNAQAEPIGEEFLVNTVVTQGNQQHPRIAMDSLGNFTIVWEDQRGVNGYDIYGQRYDAEGVAQGEAFLVNTIESANQQKSSISYDVSGNFVVTWQSEHVPGEGWNIYGREFNVDGTPVGDEFLISRAVEGDQINPSVMHTGANRFLVSWTGPGSEGNGTELYAQRFVSNSPPILIGNIDDQQAQEEIPFSFTIPDDIFRDLDDDDDLSYEAIQQGGSVLPSWLTFNASTRTFSGQPSEQDAGFINVAIKAIDGSGETASAYFKINVLLKPADLSVSSIESFEYVNGSPVALSDKAISPDSTIRLEWTITNEGPGKAREDWVDAIYLSVTPELDRTTAISLKEVSISEQTPLDVAGENQYTIQADITIPDNTALGDYYLFVVVDDTNVQSEINEQNNAASIAITVGAPDLSVESANISDRFAIGQPTTISWSVQNTGNSSTQASWSDRIYISDSPDFDPQSATLLEFKNNPKALGASVDDDNSYTQEATITLTDISPGEKYLFIVTDSDETQGEIDETNNIFSTQITVVTADLQVVATNVPEQVVLNQPTQVSWTVQNTGDGPAQGSWTDTVYLSDSPTLDASAIPLYPEQISIALGISSEDNEYTQTAEITISGSITGTKYLLFVTDDQDAQTETNESNNIRAVEITLTAPDLQPSVTVPETVISGNSVAIDWNVENVGTASTPDTAWVTHFYWSKTENIEDAELIETVTTETILAPAHQDSGTFSLDLPLDAEGQYYLIMVTDAEGAIAEVNVSDLSAESNNTIIQPINVELAPYIDLAVTSVTVPEQEIDDPASIAVEWTVSNLRNEVGRSETWVDRIWASKDDVLGNADDYILGIYTYTDGLDALDSYTRTETITFGPGFSDDLQIWVETGVTAEGENAVFENGEKSNNAKAADHRTHIMRIPYADLEVSAVTTTGDVNSGQFVALSWTVANNGIGVTHIPEWSDQVLITDDLTDARSWKSLGYFNHVGVLAPGEDYERSVQVRLPDGLEGDYYFVVRTGGPFEFIYTNNNTGMSDVVDVILPQAPDLAVNAIYIFGATEVEAGSKFDIEWTVKNRGKGSPNNTWSDRVSLQSIDGTQTINLGTFTYPQGLEPGETYTRSEQFSVPNVQGTYHVVVETNEGQTLYEGANIHENSFFNGSQSLTIVFPPRADLRVAAVEVGDSSVLAGNPLNVSFIVENQGAVSTSESNPTSNWVDRIYLSLDDKIDGSDILLGELTNSAALGAGEQYQTIDIETALIPRYFRGEAYVVVQTDATNRVDEFPQDGNNTRARLITIDPLPPADLVTSAVAAPSQAFDGTTIDVSYTVTNKGIGETDRDRWQDTVWLTRDKNRPSAFAAGSPPEAEDILLGTFSHNGSLTVDASNGSATSYTNTVQVRLPEHVSGEWYITVWSDALDLVTEDTISDNVNPDDPNELHSNNYSSTPISVLLTPPPDLVVSSITATPEAKGGDRFSVSWTVDNQGSTAATGHWYDEVYISTTSSLSESGQRWYLGRVDRSQELASGDGYTAQLDVDLAPSVQGGYVIVKTNAGLTAWEGSTGHAHRANNAHVVETDVTREAADLVVSAVTATDADSGELTTVSWTVTNAGADVWEGTDYWYDEIWVSPDPTFIKDRATRVGFFVHNADQPLKAGESYTQTKDVRLPAGIDGEYYVHVSTDYSHNRNTSQYRGDDFDGSGTYSNDAALRQLQYSVFEDPSNNWGVGALTVEYREPDLKPTLTLSPFTADSGTEITVEWEVTNAGTRDTRQGSWNDRIYLSTDPSLDIYDVMLASVQRKGILASGESYTQTADIRLPDGIEGDYYLILVGDANLKPDRREPKLIYDSTSATYRQYAAVPEFQDEGDNVVASALQVTLTPPPDLQVTRLNAPDVATVGQL
ncbi:MAG: hypothetical protein F6K16_28965 [Symploca sp. SIO2B6]|nr:hypothetical protein [Symploca sp. SIO2B6]